MAASLRLNIVDGAQRPIGKKTELLVSVIDGQQKRLVSRFFTSGVIQINGLPMHGTSADRYTVLVSAKGHVDAGVTPFTPRDGEVNTLDLMLLPRGGTPQFRSLAQIQEQHPDVHRIFRGDRSLADAEKAFRDLQQSKPLALACFMNVCTALDKLSLATAAGATAAPLSSFVALHPTRPFEQDRFYVLVNEDLRSHLVATNAKVKSDPTQRAVARFVSAPGALHKGATASFKQTDFGEANVQLTFLEPAVGEQPPPSGHALVDADIDYFRSNDAHILLEVFPHMLRKGLGIVASVFGADLPRSLTDPLRVYGLRWIAGKRVGHTFAPPYTIA
jgi:hypothetical protein